MMRSRDERVRRSFGQRSPSSAKKRGGFDG